MYKIIILIFLIFISVANVYPADEILIGEDYTKDAIVLNEELRKTEKSIDTSLTTAKTYSETYADSLFPVTAANKVNTSAIYGTLPVANGGTGATSFVAAGLVRIKTGTYTGDGGTTKAITGIGFQPIVVYIYAKSGVAGHYVKIDQDTGAYAHYIDSAATVFQDNLITINSNGFTVGNGSGGSGENPNTNTAVFDYVCLG